MPFAVILTISYKYTHEIHHLKVEAGKKEM